ncbi:MAG: YggS family pyridoxal phosphate-dependent enzyme [Bacteroidetes bacterium]|nr:YggS family pyridoxal phosphate-dependent enzyme [Bacteroidota bacterium]
MPDLAARLAAIHGRIEAACVRSGRDPQAVTLVAVTKTHPVKTVHAALDAGLTAVGENKVQELAAKREALASAPAVWHYLGRVQTNKARDIVRYADLIHGVDSLRAGEALARRMEAEGRRVPVLVQVNVSGEASKAGVEPEQAAALVDGLRGLGLDVHGLMTLASPADDPEAVRPEFARMRRLRDDLGGADRLPILSMGMSGDFEVAVEEGATHVRVGSALFGDRA